MGSSKDIGRQALVERRMLLHIEQALRVVLEWETQEANCARKLSTLRFTAQSFHRHLNRMRALAESDGYLSVVVEAKPQLGPTVHELEGRRNRLESVLDRIMARLEQVSPDDLRRVNQQCADLQSFLDELQLHNQEETALIQEALVLDLGGSG